MSLKVVVYVPALSAEFLPRIAAKFSESGMECEFHPNFVLDSAHDLGTVTARLRVLGTCMPQYENRELLCRFEMTVKDFRYISPPAYNPDVNQKLKTCTKQIAIRMGSVPTCSYRAGLYFAGFLTQVADGIMYFPRSDDYLEPVSALDQVVAEINTYERELPLEGWTVEPFGGW